MTKKYIVKLSDSERETLERMGKSGHESARTLTRVRILLKSDASEGGPR